QSASLFPAAATGVSLGTTATSRARTVTRRSALRSPDEARMVVEPGARAVSMPPAVTEATSVLEDVHSMVAPVADAPLAFRAEAEMRTVSPTVITGWMSPSSTDVPTLGSGGGALTEIGSTCDTLPERAEICTVP